MNRAAALVLAGMLGLPLGVMAEEGGLYGAWTGTYRCAQGLTGVTLTLREAKPPEARALFHFYADASNPGVPTGCFLMQGSYDPASGSLQLRGGEWLLRPAGYVVVNFIGQVDPAGQRFTGRVEGPSCTDFALERRKAALVPPACEVTSGLPQLEPIPAAGR